MQVCSKGFDASLGFPGEGPRPTRASSAPPRVPRDLSEALHTTVTVADRKKALERLADYLSDEGYPPPEVLAEDRTAINKILAGYVQHLYDASARSTSKLVPQRHSSRFPPPS